MTEQAWVPQNVVCKGPEASVHYCTPRRKLRFEHFQQCRESRHRQSNLFARLVIPDPFHETDGEARVDHASLQENRLCRYSKAEDTENSHPRSRVQIWPEKQGDVGIHGPRFLQAGVGGDSLRDPFHTTFTSEFPPVIHSKNSLG